MSNFFIRRPIVAIVISILMVIIGAITIIGLPVAQFPDIAPPEIRLQAIYPGADAETMEKAVATPIEQQINGVDNMDYMYSLNSTNNSSSTLLVDFDLKTDPNMDLILTQSRQQLANGQLPPEVNQIGIDVKKSLTSPMMLIALYSPKGTHDAKFLSNYGYINLKEPISRAYGVGQVQIYGIGEYAMRLWVKPDQLAKLGITVSEVANAVQSQNTVNPAGQVGGEPAADGQKFTYAVRAQGRLRTPEEFGDIVVRENADGGVVRVKDVAHVELGSQDYSWITRLNGQPSAIIGIYQLPGSNAVEAAKGVRKLMAKMKESFPADVDYAVTLDTTDAVRAGMHEIVLTLAIAFVLVILVVYLFLQDWRATLIPMLAVPVSLVATFIVFPVVRVLRQYAFAVRPGAGDRSGRGRRYRRGRRHTAPYRRRYGAERCGAQGYGGVDRPGGRYRTRPLRGVRADGLYPGHYRATLSAVCLDDRDLCHRFSVQRPDVESLRSADSCSGRRKRRMVRWPGSSAGSTACSRGAPISTCGCPARSSERAPSPWLHLRRLRSALILRESGAHELSARRRPGLHVHPDAAA